jgi:hypothetical protein
MCVWCLSKLSEVTGQVGGIDLLLSFSHLTSELETDRSSSCRLCKS